MKTVQKLELGCSISVVVAALFKFILLIFFKANGSEEPAILYFLAAIFLLLPTFVILISVYVHAVKNINVGFWILLSFGIPFVFFWMFYVLYSLLVAPLNTFTTILMISLFVNCLLVGCTMVLAFINTLTSEKQKKFS
jgi:hypothetical protein